jgi:hypothetical protein
MNFELERSPSASYDSESEERTGDWLFGEQYSWGAKVRAMYQALAAPRSGVAFPVPPTADDYVFAACSYWAPLVHLLAYSLGWSRPDLGMRWWYDAGKPVDDLRLSLVAELWDADGFLDWFSAWLWSGSTGFPERLQQFMTRPAEHGRVAVDENWLSGRTLRATESGIPNPLSGGYDPLHLSHHCIGPATRTEVSGASVFETDPSRRRALLVLTRTAGWYWSLCELGSKLPNVGPRSWHVDVYARPVGWLGAYRRSRQTGLWFAGAHSLHMRGNDG